MIKRLLLEFLKNQSVYETVVPIVEVNSFFDSPQDSGVAENSNGFAATAGSTVALITVPLDEVWMVNHVSMHIAPAAAGYQHYSVFVDRQRSSGNDYLGLLEFGFTEAGVASGTMAYVPGRQFAHPVYVEGGSVFSVAGLNGTAAGTVVQLFVDFAPVGKIQRS